MNVTLSSQLTKARVNELLLKQAAAPIIAVAGPSSSTKSTVLAEIVADETKKLLSRNIGSKQTSLFYTLLMLNSDIDDGRVIIQCKTKSVDRVTFKHQLELTLGDYLYANRDDLEELDFDQTVLKQVLDPNNRAYHFYEYVNNLTNDLPEENLCPTLTQLQSILLELFEKISPDLIDRVRQREKEAKTVTPRPKKERLFQLEISSQLEQHPEILQKYYDWFDQLHQHVMGQIKSTCTEIEPDTYVLFGNVSQFEVQEFVKNAYDKNSPYSLVVEQIAFMVQPNEEFSKLYRENYMSHKYENKVLRLNVLDTPGLTQISEEKSEIQDAFDRVLKLNFNALMFLCGSNRSTTEFLVSRELIFNNKKKIGERPLSFVRTKADTVIDAVLREKSRVENGSGQLKEEFIAKEAQNAYKVLITEIEDENSLFSKESITPSISGNHVEFLCMELDRLGAVNDHLSEKFTTDKLYHLLINLSLSVHNMYSPASKDGVKYCVRSIRADLPALQINMEGYFAMIADNFATMMIQRHEKHKESKDSYLKYEGSKFTFHGRSVSTYVKKHRYGVGHETTANVYENFKIHICSIIERWINEYFTDWNTNFDVDRSNLHPLNSSGQMAINNVESALLEQFKLHKQRIIRSIAKSLSYDEFKDSFEKCYWYMSWDGGFRKNMRLFNQTFSNRDYWSNGFKKALKNELEALLAKMYLYE